MIPVVHIADQSFYDAIKARLEECDAVIFEGVKSFRGRLLTLAYRLPAKRKSLRLVLQSEAIPCKDLQPLAIHGDVDSQTFTDSWLQVPWRQRLALMVLAPLYGAALYMLASREFIWRRESVDSLPSVKRQATADECPELLDALVDRRDQCLLESVKKHLVSNGDKETTTAILFGGGHAPGITGMLMAKHGYKVVQSEWITAISARR